mgnify:CR=1 FL=1
MMHSRCSMSVTARGCRSAPQPPCAGSLAARLRRLGQKGGARGGARAGRGKGAVRFSGSGMARCGAGTARQYGRRLRCFPACRQSCNMLKAIARLAAGKSRRYKNGVTGTPRLGRSGSNVGGVQETWLSRCSGFVARPGGATPTCAGSGRFRHSTDVNQKAVGC